MSASKSFDVPGLGYFPASDSGYFKRRMRVHQAWWRAEKLNLNRTGEFPPGTPNASILADKDAEDGKNFLSKGIAEIAVRSRGAKVEKFRNESNLLSSQPMAFNLFGPMQADPELAVRLLDPSLPGGVSSAKVKIEHTPPSKEYLNDGTSLDALIDYVDREGLRNLIAVEVKLTETFSTASKQKRPDRDNYREEAKRIGIWKDVDDPDSALKKTAGWQLWRNHMMIELMKDHENDLSSTTQPVMNACLWVIHHQDDENCVPSLDKYAACLKRPDDCFHADNLNDLTALWREHAGTDDVRNWLESFRERYVDLTGSEASYQAYCNTAGIVTRSPKRTIASTARSILPSRG